jgi:hypothetical protein
MYNRRNYWQQQRDRIQQEQLYQQEEREAPGQKG